MFKHTLCMLAVAAITVPAMMAAEAEWSTDFEGAKAQAAKEGKAILVDFTGSDWCGWCIKLRKDVFDKPEFQEYAKDKFVLMEVDMPRAKKQAPELRLQNNKLCKQFQVDGFPTILIISPEEDVLGGFVGGNFSPQQVQEFADAAFANLGKLKTAREAVGVERAKLLGEIVKSLPKEFRGITRKYIDEINANDPDGESKATDLTPEEQMDNFVADLHSLGDNYAAIVELADGFLATVDPEFRADVLQIKAQALTYGAETEEDIIKAREALQEAATMLGYSREARQLRKYIDQEYGDPAAALKKVKENRSAQIASGCGSELQQLISKLSHSTDQECLELIDAQLAKGNEGEKAELLRLRATVLLRMADSVEDIQKAKQTFEESAAEFGDTKEGSDLRQYIDSEFADVKGLLERVRQFRVENTPEKRAAQEELHDVILAIHRTGNDYKKALAIIDAQLAKGVPAQRAELLRLKGIALINSAETVEDLAKAKDVMLEAAELMGDTNEAKDIRTYIDKEMQDQEGLLERVKGQR